MSQNIFIGVIAVSLLALIIVNVASCGCNGNNRNNGNRDSENYVQEYSGNTPNYRTCSDSYRLYADSSEETDSYPRNRCKFCKDYNSVESFIDTTNTFKLCPHNCRQYGVSSCDQGSML
jgi:hypothetical protein